MTNRDMASKDIRRAAVIVDEARGLLARGVWNLVVRRCQEAVELALKGALRWAALEVPKVHDVGPHLARHADRFPEWLRSEVAQLAEISRWLRGEREASFYGTAEAHQSPEEIYDEADALRALQDAVFVLNLCERLVG